MKTGAVRLAEFIEAGLDVAAETFTVGLQPVVLLALVGMQGSVVRALRALYNESEKNGQRGNVAAKILGVPQGLIKTVEEMEFAGMRPFEIADMLQRSPEVLAAELSDSSARGRRVLS